MERSVRLETEGGWIEGDLVLPRDAGGLVLFAHGSGSSRHSPRNRFVARVLQESGFGTLLVDLLTEREEAAEERGAMLRFDIEHLARRLALATEWVAGEKSSRGLGLGLFGASTGAAAALVAAAREPERIAAVVSRGGRPDLAGEALGKVRAPTLLIVGGHDREVLALNRAALARLDAVKELAVVPGATHLFEEPGALAEVARLAAAWFGRHLNRRAEHERSPTDQRR